MSTSSQKPQPDSEWETAAHQHIAELLYPTYGQRDTNRSLAIADAVMPAVRKAVDICVTAEVARLRARVAELEQVTPSLTAERTAIKGVIYWAVQEHRDDPDLASRLVKAVTEALAEIRTEGGAR
ncbi:hypothetical protein ACH0CM_12425 [Streptomyces albus]|uniref:hypothetical protein n=1 Tax=Streptomyces albus TaxID=1888 RepID=UPI00387A0FA0